MALATALAITALGAGIFESIAQTQEAAVEAQAQEFAAGADLFNADIARQEARLVQARAKIDIARRRKAGERLVSEQQVLFAASGVRIDEGTPLIVMEDTLYENELDLLILQFNADIESQFLESQARQSELQAEQRRGVATQARIAGRLRAGKTLLSSLTTFGTAFAGAGVQPWTSPTGQQFFPRTPGLVYTPGK